MNSINNYRPITLYPIISKIFEYCVLHKFESQLSSNQLQCDFLKLCSHAVSVLSRITDYYSFINKRAWWTSR